MPGASRGVRGICRGASDGEIKRVSASARERLCETESIRDRARECALGRGKAPSVNSSIASTELVRRVERILIARRAPIVL